MEGKNIKYLFLFILSGAFLSLAFAGGNNNKANNSNLRSDFCDSARKFKLTPDLNCYKDYKAGIRCSKELNKPVLLYFNANLGLNCRNMEQNIFTNKKIHKYFADRFIVISLVVDDTTRLPVNEQYNSRLLGTMVRTAGERNYDLELSKFNRDIQPFFVIIDKRMKN